MTWAAAVATPGPTASTEEASSAAISSAVIRARRRERNMRVTAGKAKPSTCESWWRPGSVRPTWATSSCSGACATSSAPEERR